METQPRVLVQAMADQVSFCQKMQFMLSEEEEEEEEEDEEDEEEEDEEE